jgi:superfamily II DNA/RNA helicase
MRAFTSIDLLASLQSTLAEKGLVHLTDIQARVLPLLVADRSVVGIAETGSGKTLAYALPILHRLKALEIDGDPVRTEARPRAVVLVPSRELGEQVTRVFKPFTHTTRLRVRSVLGGTQLEVAKRNVSGIFEVLVATPGRLVKLLERGLVKFDDVRTLVFDEADQMLDHGFLPSATRIVAACPPERQLALFSATVSPKVQELITKLFSNVEVVRSEGSHQVVRGLTTKNLTVNDGKRFPILEGLLGDAVDGGTMIFTNTRDQCDKVARQIEQAGHACVVYRGEMDKVERRKNLKLFRDGKIPFLVSTDLASRGLDVDHVGRVINYHLPQQMENYLHRVGRTARAGRRGLVINLVTERDAAFIAKIERKFVPAAEWPSEPAHRPTISTKITPVADGGRKVIAQVTRRK